MKEIYTLTKGYEDEDETIIAHFTDIKEARMAMQFHSDYIKRNYQTDIDWFTTDFVHFKDGTVIAIDSHFVCTNANEYKTNFDFLNDL